MIVKRIVANIFTTEVSAAERVRRFFVRDPFGKLVNILSHR
jgi:hypothetical protein